MLLQVLEHVLLDVAFEVIGQDLVDLRDEVPHLGNELDQALRDEDDTVVLAFAGTRLDYVSNLIRYLLECLLLGSYFLADQAAVHARLQGAL